MFKKKIVIIFAVVFIIAILINLLLYYVSYHEENNYLQISSMQFTSDNKHIECNTEKEIKNMEHKLRKINFYHSNSKNLQESPQYCITIIYNNGIKKHINVSGLNAMIVIQPKSEEIIKALSKFYYVNPFAIHRLFK